MATAYTYQLRVASFTDGTTTFNATEPGVYVKDGGAEGPTVINRIEHNDAGTIIDLDGTGAAALVPPIVTQNIVFKAASPGAQTQYVNLIKLKGKHGTFGGHIPGASGNAVVTAPARLIEVTGNWQPPHKVGTESMMVLTAKWQLKDFLSS